MKYALIAFTLISTSITFADIRRQPDVDTRTISGEAAAKLMNKMPGVLKQGSALRTSSSVYKINREAGGLKQIICEKTSYSMGPKKVEVRCTIERSLDGRPLPVFKPIIRMG